MLKLSKFKDSLVVSEMSTKSLGGQDGDYTEEGNPTPNCDWHAIIDGGCCERTDYNCCQT